MDKLAAQKRIKKLIAEVEYHSHLYHTLDKPEISDEAYDALYAELVALEKRYPELKKETSPTTKVGGAVIDAFDKVSHPIRQWGYDNIFTFEELKQWQSRLKKLASGCNVDYLCELKIDGVKMVLEYRGGRLLRAATRGDGMVGENITHNVRTIDSVPLELPEKLDLLVVGEVWIDNEDLEKINRERNKNGLPLYANTRNLTAGSLRQLDSNITETRNLKSFMYDLFDLSTKKNLKESREEELLELSRLGFLVNPNFRYCVDIDEVQNYYIDWQEKGRRLQYGVDGVVVKINDNRLASDLGYTAKAPRFAIAYKFPAEETTTKVLGITVQVGRTGALTPVAELAPVRLAETKVSRASLHNFEEIDRLGLLIGDTVIIKKAGDIIPKIIKVLPKLRTGEEVKFDIGDYAHEKGWKIEKKETSLGKESANWYLVAGNQVEILIQRLTHYASKGAMNIVGLGEKIIRALVLSGLVVGLPDIYRLQKAELLKLEGFKDRSVDNLLTAIEKSKKPELERFLFSLGIEHVGIETARILAYKYKTFGAIRKASAVDLELIDGIGETVAGSVSTWFSDRENRLFLEQLLEFVRPNSKTEVAAQLPLMGKSFVFTGTMRKRTREEAGNLVRSLGGKVVAALSGNTSYLVAGENSGSKLAKAKKLGIEVLSEDEFLKLMKV